MSILGVPWWMHALRAGASAVALWFLLEAGAHIPDVRPATVAMVGTLVTLFFAIRWGPISAVAGGLSTALAFDYYFMPPTHSLGFEDGEGMVAAFAVLVTSVAVSYVSLISERNRAEAERGRLEAERLNRLGDALLPSTTSKAVAHTVVDRLATQFGARSATLEFAGGAVFRVGAPETSPASDSVTLPIQVGRETVGRLVIDGGGLSPAALDAISHQLTMVLGRVRAAEQLARFAADIQMGMLPNTFPAFPSDPELDLYARLEPALEVGGDFYDHFRLPDDRICFLIGDVSDKGVPAALFMAMVVTAFRILAVAPRRTVAEMMSALNHYVCENNRTGMFVTALAGAFDPRTGAVEYCDAGHEPPFIVRASGRVEMVEKVGGMALGIMPDHVFISGSLALGAGDTLVTYTDGVNEAMDPEHHQFSTPAIAEVLCHLARNADARATCDALLERVHAFAAGAPQSDDITLLALRYLGAAASAQSAK